MKPIPQNVLAGYNDLLKQRNVPSAFLADYRKWLLYFLDFRAKYPLPDSPPDQVKLFADKLRSKNQTAGQVEQAADAISFFFAISPGNKSTTGLATVSAPAAALCGRQQEGTGADRNSFSPKSVSQMVCEPPGGFQFAPTVRSGKQYDEWRCLRKTESPAWDNVIENIAAEIKVRHYSRKTLKAYADWCRKFQNYLKNKAPGELSPQDVKAYLTHLAVNCNVSASRQNQAFNALLFLYRHVLKKDFGTHKDIPRAKTSNYIPTVLCRKEIDSVLVHLRHPFKLVAQLRTAAGCVSPRVVNCGSRISTSIRASLRSGERAKKYGPCLCRRRSSRNCKLSWSA